MTTVTTLVTHDVVTSVLCNANALRVKFVVCCRKYGENYLTDKARIFIYTSEIFLSDHWREGSEGNDRIHEDLRRFCFVLHNETNAV